MKTWISRIVSKICREETGSVAVVVAISMTVLFGFVSLAVDFGMLASSKGSLQNAADAAALAAAQDLGAGRSGLVVQETALLYIEENGFDPSGGDVTVDVSISGKTVKVTVQKETTMGFSAVLTGSRTRTVSASATARAESIFSNCPYALFAGERIEDDGTGIVISGNNIQINGNIHSNSDISMAHATLGEGAIATAVNQTNPSTTGWNSRSIALDMPSYSSFSSSLSGISGMVEFTGNVTKSSNSGGFQSLITEAVTKYHNRMGLDYSYYYTGLYIHIAGNLTFNGNASTIYTSSFPIILIVDGDINLNGAPITSTADNPVTVISKTGDITVNGGGAYFTGILFAPEGDVTLNGNNATFTGSIIAENIRKTGGKITVNYRENLDRFLPRTKVRLIE